MSTRHVALKVRTGQGSAAVAAVPGLAPVAPVPPVPPVPPVAPVPPRPVDPPSIPPRAVEPSAPEPPAPAPALADPPYRPTFTDGPGLNWIGRGDRWSQAWAVETLGAVPPTPLPHTLADQDAANRLPTPRDIELIRASLAVVEPIADRVTAYFYALIFLHHPEVRALFPAAMDVQRDRLFRALLMAARNADQPVGLTEYLTKLGRGHRKYGTMSAHYGPVGACLIAALAKHCGNRWDADTELAWRRVYGLIAKIMIDASEQAAKTSPPWWQAEIVDHRLPAPNVAVLTLRPHQHYPYRAGQYTTLETPWWPRVWRHYSLASAPRSDGLLSLHVKAVQAGWVSNALVHRAAPGDALRLGPAAGGMVIDHTSGTDLLCVGGGTGIAPISAMVEEVAAQGANGRSVEVFYGARRGADLYQLEALKRLAQRNSWLSVRAVVVDSDGAPGDTLVGELPEAVSRHAPWHGRHAYLSGPPAMVRRGAAALLAAGVRSVDIHHDLVGDLS